MVLAAVAAIAMVPGAVLARHEQATHAPTAQPTPPARRWAADADLRVGMSRIHTLLVELRQYELGDTDQRMALDRVGLIEHAAAGIFARCRLTPEKDAVLHDMLVRLLAAVQKLKANPRDMAQVQAMRDAVAAYPRYFDDPG